MTNDQKEVVEVTDELLDEITGGAGSFIDPDGGERGAGQHPNG